MIRVLCTALIAVVLALSPSVFAQAEPSSEDIKAAAEAFDLGRRNFKAKEWVEAAEQFEIADSRAPSAVALELAIVARERAGHPDRAATLAQLANERHPDDKKLHKLADATIKKYRGDLHEVAVTCDEPCDLVLDTKLVHGRASSARTIFVPPGNFTLRAGWSEGRAERKPLEAAPGGKSEVAFTAPPIPEPEPEQQTAPAPASVDPGPADRGVRVEAKGFPPTVFWIGVGLTGVAGIATIVSGIDAQNNPGVEKVREDCATQNTSCPTYQDALAAQTRTNVLIGVTAVLGVATAAIGAFATNWSGAPSEEARSRAAKRKMAVEPWLEVGSGARLGARGSF